MKRLIPIALILLVGIQASGRPPADFADRMRPQAAQTAFSTVYVDANRVLMFVTNNGIFGSDIGGMFSNWGPGMYFPYTSIEDIEDGTNDNSVLWSAGIWAGGRDAASGELLAAVAEFNGEYGPGPMAGGTYQPDSPRFKMYKLHSDSLADNPNVDYANWPDDLGAPVDDWGEPVMHGDQMLWTVFNDADPGLHINRAGSTSPLGIEVHQTVWSYNRDSGPLANTIFIKYTIYNRGSNPLEDFYLSLWFDPDLGGASDDMVGCDTINQTMFCYNGDNDDADYGATPPAFGVKVMYGPLIPLQGVDGHFDGNSLANHWNLPMTAFTKYINGTDPDGYQETYAYMKGLRAKEPGFPPYEYNGQTLTFMHSGDPVAGTGDLDFNPSDKRMMGSFGPLTFAPGDSQFVQIAVIAAEGSDRFNSLANLNSIMSQLGPEPHTPVTLHVPAAYPTIQAGIDAATVGDTILVADGTYTGNGNRDIDFGGKGIVLKSENGPDFTIIDCQGDSLDPHRGFNFHSGEASTAVVDGFTIQGGYGPFDSPEGYSVGGGIKCDSSSSPSLINNTISGNSAGAGGGIYCGGSNPTISNNTISGNSGVDPWWGSGGGGIACFENSSPTISNNTISGNSAGGCGGGIHCSNSSPTISNNTISGNTDSGGPWGSPIGGGIYCSQSNPTISNNTISRNSTGISCSNSSPTIINTIIWGNAGSQINVGGSGSPIITYCDIRGGWEGEGNIDDNPLLVPDNGNYNVCSQSPCIDAGDPDMTDPDGTRSDIGLFYPEHPECFVGNVWHVSTTGNDTTGDGSPENPLRTIQHAINVSLYGDTVIVQNGTYVENIDIYLKNIVLASNYIYCGDTLDIQNTIIDGGSVSSVVNIQSCDSLTAITGFTIRNGSAGYHRGGGISCRDYSNPTISYNTISGNSSGGIYCYDSSPTIRNNTISGNLGGYYGGISCNDNSNPTISNNTISGNSADYGGGIHCIHSSPTISNNTISDNDASAGGGIYCFHSNPTISNNTISGNSAGSGGGGGIYCYYSSPTISNTIIAFSSQGGAVFCYDETSNPTLTCCDVYGNAEGDWVGCIADQAGINGNFSADPLFCDTATEDYHLVASSPCAPANNECGELIGALGVGCIPTGINDEIEPELPLTFELHQNYPNPFNPVTAIDFALPQQSHVELMIYNILGQQVVTLVDEDRPPGTFSAAWHGEDSHGKPVSTGVYFYRIEAGDFVETKKMLLLK